MSSPMVRDLYEYAKEKYPAVAEHLAWLDQEIADHQTAILTILETRLAVLRNLSDGKGLESIVNPQPPRRIEDMLLRFGDKR
jgi:hypothetical protein